MPIQKHPVLMIVDLMFASLFGLGNPSVLYLHEIVTFYWTFSACDTKDVGTPLVHCTCVLLTCFRLRKKVCEGHRDFRKSLLSASCHTGQRVRDCGASRDALSDMNNGCVLTLETH